MNEQIETKLGKLIWWAVKWFVAAAIVVGCAVYGLHIKELLDRHNQLVDALTNLVRAQVVELQKK